MDKPGILLCLTYHLPNVSGLTLSAHALARNLVDQGYRARVVAAQHPADAPSHDRIDGVDVERCRSMFRLSKAAVMPGYPLAVWRAAADHDVVNIHLPCLDAATAAIAAKLRGRKLILSYVCSMSDATLSDRFARGVAAATHLVAGVLADSIHVPSQDYAEQSVFCRLFRRKLVTAPLTVPLERDPSEDRPQAKTRTATADAPFRIGFVGRISRQKNLELLFEALPRIIDRLGTNVRIDLLGPTAEVIGETYWKSILSRAAESGGQVEFHGVKHGAELARFYADLDVLVLPSIDRLESFGLVQIEAMLRGVPVVATDRPGMRTPVAKTGMGRLFAANDPDAFAEAIADVLINGPPQWLDPEQIDALFGANTASAPYRQLLDGSAKSVGATVD